MVPLSSLVRVKQSFGPDRVMRYNGFTAADINGGPAPASRRARRRPPPNASPPRRCQGHRLRMDRADLSGHPGRQCGCLVFPLCVLLVFLVLAAQYESLTLPLAVILIVPMSLLAALTGVADRGDNNIFTQIGLIVLVGLSAKNAILIVEFARELEHHGRTVVQAAIEASRLRLRPILMTSFAFIMGVVPLVVSTGAGAEMRHAMGVAVFAGMLGVTFFGLFLTPVFYVRCCLLATRGQRQKVAEQPASASQAVASAE
jgi:multidrug efflux pump